MDRAGRTVQSSDMRSSPKAHNGIAARGWLWVGAALLAAAPFASAGATDHGSFVIRAGRILTASDAGPTVLQPGIVVVRDGVIVAIGSDLEPPVDLPLYEYPDATVTPGLVAASSSIAPQRGGDESMAAGYLAIDAFLSYGDYKEALAGGVTAVHLNPGRHRLITGQGAVVKLGGTVSERVLKRKADVTLNIGEAAWGPPRDVTYQTPASSDVAIPPAVRQRPDSRLGQFLALEELLVETLAQQPDDLRTVHGIALMEAWRTDRPIRIQVQRDDDIEGAIAFLKRRGRGGYLVGGAEADRVAKDLIEADVPLVYEVAADFGPSLDDLGADPDVLEADVSALDRLRGVKLALAGPPGGSTQRLRLAAALAQRAGMSRLDVLAAMTRVPAEILGVDDRVGYLAPGRDADLVIWEGDPLSASAHPRRVFVGGRLAFAAPETDALVVRAGTVWINEKQRIRDGSILIEGGKVTAVGHRVPHPPFARVIDGGSDAFAAPGFIDAFGHLGFDGDDASTDPDLSPAGLIGVADVMGRRVAGAGVTSVVMSPYKASMRGSQVSVVKTAGRDRATRVARRTAGVLFDMRSSDPADVSRRLTKRVEQGKKYLEKWIKYRKELAEWKEKKAKGELVDGKPKREEVKEGEGGPDPITGTWSVTISGGPIPEPQTATMKLRLMGNDIEGRIIIPGAPEEARIVATLDGTHISGQIEVETPMGYPSLEADIVEEDHIVGVITIEDIKIDLDARRTDKKAVEFKVVKRKTHGKGGRPLPPKVDESLEPLRAVLEKEIPLVVAVETPAQIKAVMDVAETFEVGLVLLDAESASAHAEALAKASIGVVVPTRITRRVHHQWYHQADDLSRKGVPVAFQSDAEDGARLLPLLGLHAVERGLSADAALAALTTQASRMYMIDDRVGSLDVGRDGDVVIFSGHPFAPGSRVLRVIVNGEEVR